jgi:hypothetical protein
MDHDSGQSFTACACAAASSSLQLLQLDQRLPSRQCYDSPVETVSQLKDTLMRPLPGLALFALAFALNAAAQAPANSRPISPRQPPPRPSAR